MSCSKDQVVQNYDRCCQFIIHLLQREFRITGFEFHHDEKRSTDLVQTIAGTEQVADLIKHQVFSQETYEPAIRKAVSDVKRLFNASSYGNKDIPLERVPFLNQSREEAELWEEPVEERDGLFNRLADSLSIGNYRYLVDTLLPGIPDWERGFSRLKDFRYPIDFLENRVSLFRKFFPDGKIPEMPELKTDKRLSKQQVINSFLLVYLDMEPCFQEYFLKQDGKLKASVIVCFLLEEILNTTPENVIGENDEFFFLKHHIQNVYRYFNYSTNRVLGNAYPHRIKPWLKSRTDPFYWQAPENRINAVRWLVEDQLNINPEFIFTAAISKQDFNKNGLSYLFNNWYNSVGKALQEAYPQKRVWETTNVPQAYWNEKNAISAVRWLVEKKGWEARQLAQMAAEKKLTRKTFSEMGLATLFEKKFSTNIYRAVSLAYPGIYEPWEFGKVPAAHWKNPRNIYDASSWIAEKEGYSRQTLLMDIRNGKFTRRHIKKYSIGRVLTKLTRGNMERLFNPLYWEEHKKDLDEFRIIRRINDLKNIERKKGFLRLILNGFLSGFARPEFNPDIRRFNRISRRIKRRSVVEFHSQK